MRAYLLFCRGLFFCLRQGVVLKLSHLDFDIVSNFEFVLYKFYEFLRTNL